MPSQRTVLRSVWRQFATHCANAHPRQILMVSCGVLLLDSGCGGATENENVLARPRASGGNTVGGSTNAPRLGNGGTSKGAAGTLAGAAGTSAGAAGTLAGAAGSYPCSDQCTNGRICRKVVNAYRCVTASCGPELTATLDLPDKDGGLVALGGGHAFVLTKTALEVVDIQNPREPRLVGELAGAFVGIAWQGDRLYLAGATNALAVVDVKVPQQPKLVTTLVVPGGVSCVRAERGVAYLCAGNDKQKSGHLQVVDLTDPDQPVLRGQLATPTAVRSIDSAGSLVYLVDNDGQLDVVDAANLDQPALLATLAVTGATCVKLSGSRAFVGADNLVVIDVAVPSAPTRIANIPTAHSIRSLSVEGNLVGYMSSYGYNFGSQVQVLDVSDLAHPIVSPLLSGSADEHWIGPMIALDQGFAYVAGAGSLVVRDVSTPVNQRIVSSIPIQFGTSSGMEEEHSTVYVIAMGYGPSGSLDVINARDPLHMAVQGSFPVLAMGLAVSKQRAYLLKYNSNTGIGDELLELNLNTPGDSNNPSQVGSLAMEETLADRFNGQISITAGGDYAYLLGKEVVSIVRVNQTVLGDQPVDPELVRTIDLPGVTTNRIRHTATHAFVTASVGTADASPNSGALLVFDTTDPADPTQVAMLPTSVGLTGIALAGTHAYVGAVGQGLIVIDISIPSVPRVVGTADTPHGGEDELALLNNTVYLGEAVVDVSAPEHPVFSNTIEIPGAFRRVSSTGKLFTVVRGSSGKYGGWAGELNYIDPTRCAP